MQERCGADKSVLYPEWPARALLHLETKPASGVSGYRQGIIASWAQAIGVGAAAIELDAPLAVTS